LVDSMIKQTLVSWEFWVMDVRDVMLQVERSKIFFASPSPSFVVDFLTSSPLKSTTRSSRTNGWLVSRQAGKTMTWPSSFRDDAIGASFASARCRFSLTGRQ
jgi:hypothetical protein